MYSTVRSVVGMRSCLFHEPSHVDIRSHHLTFFVNLVHPLSPGSVDKVRKRIEMLAFSIDTASAPRKGLVSATVESV